jgi:chromosome segregation protein
MYLKSLEIVGFKSFAKKASLNFTSPISSIVGPNGSGKSNVAEAFRFVLGEQSIKSMRGKRGEDLIFNGGGDGNRVNSASVKVVFDNSKKVLNIDFPEVTLERKVHRDNSNEYFINGSQVRLKDIIELLSGAHIGASGHHIISQGEADRILNANIRERKEMVEDALGLKIYQYKKTESQKKLEKTDENMKSVESLRRELAPHLKFLKKQVEKVEKVAELRRELEDVYKQYIKIEEIYVKNEKEKINKEKEPLLKETEILDKEITNARKVLETSSHRDISSDELISIEGKLAEIRREKDSIFHESGKIEGEITVLNRALQREREAHARDEHKTVYVSQVEEIGLKIDSLKDISDAKVLFAEIKKIFTEFVSFHKGNRDNSRIDDINKELNILISKKQDLEKSLKKIQEKEDNTTVDYIELRKKIEREKDTNRDAEKQVFQIIARQNEIRGQLNAIRTRETNLAIDEENLKKEIEQAYMFVGRSAVDFADLVIDINEDRSLQHERLRKIEKIKIRIEDSGAGNGGEIMKEYKEAEERDAFLAKELSDLEISKKSLHDLIADLDMRISIEFKEGILKINSQFQEFFSLMFGGGSASLTVVKEKKKKRSLTDLGAVLSLDDGISEGTEDDENGEEGIEIQVSLPRKKIKNLMMLSGGERALTSIALLFAISQVNPPPFIILDETDAALDEANSRKYGDMIANLSKYSQLILITHNRETMSRAGVIYGVTMDGGGSSKLLSIQFEEAVKVAK